jgi:hypothetical protein
MNNNHKQASSHQITHRAIAFFYRHCVPSSIVDSKIGFYIYYYSFPMVKFGSRPTAAISILGTRQLVAGNGERKAPII